MHILTTATWMIEFHTSKKNEDIQLFLNENFDECYEIYGETPELYSALLKRAGEQNV